MKGAGGVVVVTLIFLLLRISSVSSGGSSSERGRLQVDDDLVKEDGLVPVQIFQVSETKKSEKGNSGQKVVVNRDQLFPGHGEEDDMEKEEEEEDHVGEEEEEDEEEDDNREGNEDEDLSEDSKEPSDLMGRDDIIDVVARLERDAEEEEKRELFPEVLDVLPGQHRREKRRNESSVAEEDTTLPEDLSKLPEDIADDVAAGVDEFLLLSSDEKSRTMNGTERRQFPIYMFQGQYIPEPRLNRFIDGAVRNLGTEVRIAVMDPLYFRVLPKGRVESRGKPFGKLAKDDKEEMPRDFSFDDEESRTVQEPSRVKRGLNNPQKNNSIKNPPTKLGRRRGGNNNNNNRNRVRNRKKNKRKRRRPGQRRPGGGFGANRRKNNFGNNRRKKPFRKRRPGAMRRKNFNNNNRRKNNNNNKKNKNNNKNKNNKNRFRNRRQKRRVRRNVGGGRVEGLSHVTRDGDAEMQVFGNYTLIRSHMKMGPVELAMQFRTRKGLRRTGATLPYIRMHTVTRVNSEGSEMVDFLLDRPHPESIKVRGKLFPLAQRMAKNIFARLFVPSSFLSHRLREKAALALLSKPKY